MTALSHTSFDKCGMHRIANALQGNADSGELRRRRHLQLETRATSDIRKDFRQTVGRWLNQTAFITAFSVEGKCRVGTPKQHCRAYEPCIRRQKSIQILEKRTPYPATGPMLCPRQGSAAYSVDVGILKCSQYVRQRLNNDGRRRKGERRPNMGIGLVKTYW